MLYTQPATMMIPKIGNIAASAAPHPEVFTAVMVSIAPGIVAAMIYEPMAIPMIPLIMMMNLPLGDQMIPASEPMLYTQPATMIIPRSGNIAASAAPHPDVDTFSIVEIAPGIVAATM